jgi:hypothetical protein
MATIAVILNERNVNSNTFNKDVNVLMSMAVLWLVDETHLNSTRRHNPLYSILAAART